MQKPRAILVDLIDLEVPKESERKRLEELENLVNTYGGIVVVKTIQKRGLPDYRTFIGSGKITEIEAQAEEHEANLIILNNLLKPMQLFNLGEIFRKKSAEVWDRIDLILKIFEKHAKSTEAKLQIELAQLKHMGPRIVGLGTQLSQQKGGTSMRSGQGETNIELMKRHLARQEQKIREKLKHYEIIRAGHRKRRQRQGLKTVALVGYTNAGKSSLLNAMTGKDVYIADELFATLDTRVGDLYLPNKHQKILLSDTIGFIQDLPPELIDAFKSTLAETIEADLLLHVIDSGDPEIEMKMKVVEQILEQLGVGDRSKVYVFNKIDLIKNKSPKPATKEKEEPIQPTGILPAGEKTAKILGWHTTDEKAANRFKKEMPLEPEHLRKKYHKYHPVFASAVTKKGIPDLITTIEKLL